MYNSKDDLRMINSSWDSGNFILRPYLSRYKTVLVTETVHTKSNYDKLKTVNFTLFCSKCIKQSFLGFHLSWDPRNMVLRLHVSRKYYIYSTYLKNSTSNTSKALACNFQNAGEYTGLS